MTAQDRTDGRTQSTAGGVPRPRPPVPGVPDAPETDATQPRNPAQSTDPAESREATKALVRQAAQEFEAAREAERRREPTQPRHAAGRRVGLHRRAAGALGRGVTGAAMGSVQSVWRLSAWRRTPAGGFVVPLIGLLVVVAAAAGAGATTQALSPGEPRPAAHARTAPTPDAPASLAAPEPGPSVPPTDAPSQPTHSPLDGLNSWAQPLAAVTGIPVPALKAYGHAQLVLALTTPGCHLGWTTLAGIGKVESAHGSANGATLQANGLVTPAIIGPALNGTGGRALIRDTDLGHYDGDATYDHAIGPMQFLPSTWQNYQADGDADGVYNPADLNDAALAAANYLCAGGRSLSEAGSWWAAILSYNGIPAYAQSVLTAADTYGKLSRTAPTSPATHA